MNRVCQIQIIENFIVLLWNSPRIASWCSSICKFQVSPWSWLTCNRKLMRTLILKCKRSLFYSALAFCRPVMSLQRRSAWIDKLCTLDSPALMVFEPLGLQLLHSDSWSEHRLSLMPPHLTHTMERLDHLSVSDMACRGGSTYGPNWHPPFDR